MTYPSSYDEHCRIGISNVDTWYTKSLRPSHPHFGQFTDSARFPNSADPYSPGMSNRRSSSWLRHRNLLTAEAAMLVAVGMQLMQTYVSERPDVPWGIKTLMVMVVNGGLLGGLLLLVTTLARSSLSSAHKVVQAVPLPTPFLAIHVIILGALFVLYAHIWEFWPR